MGVMSLKKTTYVTTRFEIYGGFFVDVVNNEKTNYVDFSLGRENDSTKMDMFSIPAKNCPESKWEGYKNILQLILKNSSAEEMQKMMSYINIVIP